MAAEFPTTLPSIARVSPTDYMNDAGKEADLLHNKLADEVEALAAVVGVTGSVVQGTVESRITDINRSALVGKQGAAALCSAMTSAYQCAAIQVLGDSTGDSSTEWPSLLAAKIANDYPAWTVRVMTFSDATQQYGAPTVIQTGTAGDRYMDMTTGTNGRSLSTGQSPHMSGVIDLRMKLRMSSWVPAAQNNVFGKSGNPPNRGWYAFINTAGYLQIAYSTDGTALASINSTAATGFAPDTDGWVRWLFTPDDGAGNRVFKAYKSTDGITWTQIGSTTTTAGAVSIYNNTARMELGSIQSALAPQVTRIYEVQLRNGLDGPLVAPAMPDLWPPRDGTSCYFTGAPVLTIVNGSIAGAGITGGANYLSDATRLPKLTPDYGQVLCFLSCSHNDGYEFGREYRGVYTQWVQDVQSALPGVPVCLLTQNPEQTGATWDREHANRRFDILSVAQALNVSAVDTYQAFLDNVNWRSEYMTDAVHPNSAGQAIWKEYISKLFIET